ncbi:unnamed protein product [Clavelina lepadiformis]|uniref:Uncharacterized protein n=1 Tax=Clavelina lepadiformis TaxID=159417 RepID=A0ABP0FX34_CLALP
MHELKQLTTLEELKSAVATTATRKACTHRRDISLALSATQLRSHVAHQDQEQQCDRAHWMQLSTLSHESTLARKAKIQAHWSTSPAFQPQGEAGYEAAPQKQHVRHPGQQTASLKKI